MSHLPRKHFGQHFLCDQTIIDRIIAVINPHPDDIIVEIGPGQGALTAGLLQKVPLLHAIEIDQNLIGPLEARSKRWPGKLSLYQHDVLEFDFKTLYQSGKLLRIVGNLPYNISTPILFHLLSFHSMIKDMVFMLQKEVADRIAATAGSKQYGRLSIMVQYYCQVELCFDVPPEAFYPPPAVQSTILAILPFQTLPFVAKDESLFAKVVKLAFSKRRKTLRNCLKSLVNDALWAQLAIDPRRRAETLSVKEFVAISNALTE